MPRGEIFNLGNPSEEEPKDSSRRDFLKKLGLGAAGLAAAGGGAELARRFLGTSEAEQKAEEPEVFPPSVEYHKDEHLYKDGETVETKVARVKVDGWKLSFPEIDLAQSAWMSMDVVSGKEGGYSFLVRGAKGELVGWLSRFPSDSSEIISPNSGKSKDGFMDAQAIYVLPELNDPSLRLSLRMYDSKTASLSDYFENFESGKKLPKKKDLPTKVHDYQIELKSYGFQPEDARDKLRACSEVELPKAEMGQVHRLHRLFSEFSDPGQVFIRKGGRVLRGQTGQQAGAIDHQDPLYNRVILSSENFTDPFYEKEGEIAACHELSHGVLHNSKLSGKQLECWRDLQRGHRQVLEASGDTSFRRFAPFTVFREGSYMKPLGGEQTKESEFGHPWDNENELFASAIVTLRYFSRDFLAAFSKLKPNEQQMVRAEVKDVLKFLESMNKSQDMIKRLLPEIEAVRGALGI